VTEPPKKRPVRSLRGPDVPTATEPPKGVTPPLDLLAVALAAADAAAADLAAARPAQITSKSHPGDLVTELDVATERRIRAILAQRAPGIPVVGEEGGADADAGEPVPLRWLVDPIDGTVNFAHGLPLWTVSIALEDPAGPVVGVVVAPALGWRFWAARGTGAWTGAASAPEPLSVSACDSLERALLVSGFPYDRATNPDNNFAEWEHFQRHAGACRRTGCASLDLCMVARGWFDGYWERGLQAWDLAAGAVIVAEAGGRVTDTRGARFEADSGEVVAATGGIHDAMIRHLALVAGARQN
jgi:myo-inositol-1(or 4)-monophosphatase